jgi:hypothetical protein
MTFLARMVHDASVAPLMYLLCDRGHVGQGTFGSLSTIDGIGIGIFICFS